MFSLGCFGGVLHLPIVQIYPSISVSEAAAPPIKMMACTLDLYSVIITKQLHTCKYTAIDCTIVTLAEDRGWIWDLCFVLHLPAPPYFKILARTLVLTTKDFMVEASYMSITVLLRVCSRINRSTLWVVEASCFVGGCVCWFCPVHNKVWWFILFDILAI